MIFSLVCVILTRLLFCLHVFVSVGLLVYHSKQPLFWGFLSGIIFIILEMLHVILKRKGKEYKFFWPSCFLYLSAMLPVIWVMELDLLQHRLDERDQLFSRLNNPSAPPITIKGLDIRAVFDDNIAAKKVAELGVVILIILGRWLLPRGQLTRDQLSTLLLGYIGMGADILDLFSSLSHDGVAYNINMHYITLAVFSWSMLQFCITARVTAGSDETANDIDLPGTTASSPTNVEDGPCNLETKASIRSSSRRFRLDADLLQILVPVFMQDGPFLALRLVMILKFHVADEVLIYFTGKNALTLTLLLYRLYCLKTKERVDPDRTSRSEVKLDTVLLAKGVSKNAGDANQETNLELNLDTNQEIPGDSSMSPAFNKSMPKVAV